MVWLQGLPRAVGTNLFSRLHGATTGEIVAVGVGIAILALCCAICLIFYAVKELFVDDDDVVVHAGGLMRAHDLDAADRSTLARTSASLAAHPRRAAASDPTSKPGPRVRWLPHLRRPVARGYMRTGTAEDDVERTQFSIGDESDEEKDEELRQHAGGGDDLGGERPSYDGSVHTSASASLSLQVEVPRGVGRSLRFHTMSGAEIYVPLPASTDAGELLQFTLLPSQLGALPPEDVLGLHAGRFSVDRVPS